MPLTRGLAAGCRRGPGSRHGVGASLGLGLLLALGAGCAGERAGFGRYDREDLERGLRDGDPRAQGLVLGEFPLKQDAIVDGDTVKVGGLDASLRLLGLDTEETFKKETEKRAFEQGWEVYLEQEQAKTSRPVKIATPLGMEAKYFAQEYFKGVTRVRLERDHPKEIRGAYSRYLAYVMVEKGGEWENYNVEAVRAGMSPYFTKYGYSRRFHDEFVQAQEEARAAKVGIWEPGAEHYRDYEFRLKWWDGRAEYIARFEEEQRSDPSLMTLTHWDAMRRLVELEGQEIELLGTVGDIRRGRGPTRVLLARRQFESFPLIFFDPYVLEDSKIEQYRGEYVRVRGTITIYRSKKTGAVIPQIVVDSPSQVRGPDYMYPGSPGAPEPGKDLEAGPPATLEPSAEPEATEAPTVAPESSPADSDPTTSPPPAAAEAPGTSETPSPTGAAAPSPPPGKP